MVMDYERTILQETITSTTQEMFNIITRYVTEWYFSRLVVRYTISSVVQFIKNLWRTTIGEGNPRCLRKLEDGY